VGALLEQVCSPDHLRGAWLRVERRGASGGFDAVSVTDFAARAEYHLERLAEDLRCGTYSPEPLVAFPIPKPNHPGETRELRMPAVRDKIAQEAVRSLIAPVLEKTFVNCSYAYRPGKGPRKAIGRVEDYIHRGNRWVACGDIDRFFDTMDHDLALRALAEQFRDPELLRLIALWMRSGAVDGRGEWLDSTLGVPQGNVVSPLLSNLYLTPFDRHVTEQGGRLVRYADDFVLLATTEQEASDALARAARFLQQDRKLHLNDEPNPVRALDAGFVFLGIHFHGNLRRIADNKMEAIATEIRQLCRRLSSATPAALVDKLNQAIIGWRNYYSLIQPAEQFRSLDRSIRETLDATLRRAKVGDAAIQEGWKRLQRLQPEGDAPRGFERRSRPISQRAHPGEVGDPVETARKESDRMISRRKRRYLRESLETSELVISQPGVFLGKTFGRITIKRQGQLLHEVQVRRLRHVVVTGTGVAMSSDALLHCAENGISVSFLSRRGEPLARLAGYRHPEGRVGLAQLQAVNDGGGLDLARRFVIGKLKNQLSLLKYYHKYRKRADPGFAELFSAVEPELERLIEQVRQHVFATGPYETGRNRLFAFEGQGGNLYWKAVAALLEGDAEFRGRERKGAKDLVNALLNYGYGMLYPRVYRELVHAGLNPCISFLHSFQGQKPTLSYDLIEEFRPHVVDRAVIGMLTKKEDLAIEAKTGRLTRETVNRLVTNVLERLAAPTEYRTASLPLGEIIGRQARLLAAHLMGQRQYRPFLARW
jgi:group II intron reverse transcriptase/maturase/CRISPR-associated endonuclease Cas1